MEDGDNLKAYHDFNLNKRNIIEVCRAFLQEIKPLNPGFIKRR